jgi:hypothetical protein
MGDLYYDGVLDAHNRNFFITHSGEEIDGGSPNCYEVIFFCYRMDSVLSALIEQKHKNDHGAYMSARYYAENHLIAEGILLERHLDRTRNR